MSKNLLLKPNSLIRLFILSLFIGLFVSNISFAQTYKWSNVAMGGGGFVDGIITSKTEQNLMYARTDVGGAYRWNSTTNSCIPLLDWTSEDETGYQGVESLALDPQISSNLYMLVGTSYFNNGKTAILRSTDYGNTFSIIDVSSQFKAHGNGMGRQNGEKLVVDPNKSTVLYCGTRANGLFKSINSGSAWTRLSGLNITTTPNENGISFVLIDPSSGSKGNESKNIYAAVSNSGSNFYVSKDGGITFNAVPNAPTDMMPQRAVLANDNNMYITYADKEGPWNPSSGKIMKYNTTSGLWTNVSPAGTTFPYSGISVDPKNPLRLIASTQNVYNKQYTNTYGDRFYLSSDGGATWRDLVGNNGITLDPNGCTWIYGQSIHWAGCIEFNPFNTKQAMVISGNGLFTCDDVGATNTTWKFSAKGIEETVALDIVSIPDGGPLVSVIGDYDGFKHTDITQFAPVHSPRMGTTTGLAVAALNTSKMVRVGGDDKGGKMYYTANQGASWTLTASINGYKGKLALSANGNTLLHCPEGSSTTYRSINDGSVWENTNLNIKDAVPVADQINSNKFYAYNRTSGAFQVSTDGGINFNTTTTLASYGSQIVRTVPSKEGHVWVALYNNGLTRTINSGQSFTKLNSVTNCSAVGLGKEAPGKNYFTIYIWGTVNNTKGVFSSTDEGITWTRINDNEHEYGGPGNGQFVIGDMNTYGRVYMSTVGRGIAFGEISGVTSIENNLAINDKLSTEVTCFPNPSNNSFTLNTKGSFSYTLFDSKGREMEFGTAVNEVNIGDNLKSGIYLLKIQNDVNSKIIKVIKN